MPQPSERADGSALGLASSSGEVIFSAEYEQLISENLEYMALLSRYARTLGLCSTLDFEPLCERIVEILCLETRTLGGLLWTTRDESGGPLRLAVARGVAKPGEEPGPLDARSMLAGANGDPASGAFVVPASGVEQSEALCVPLRHGGRLLALARVHDRIDASTFETRDLGAADQVAEIAAPALANALRFRAAQHRSLRDPSTRACTPAFFDGLVAAEFEKALRFDRPLSLVEIALPGLPGLRERLGDSAARAIREGFANRLQSALRGTDMCAPDGENRFRLLLTETDAIGAAVLKHRILELTLPESGSGASAEGLRISSVTLPRDGTRLEDLRRCLSERLETESRSAARILERECSDFAECRQRLLYDAIAVPPRLPEQALRFALEELRRCASERALVWLCPGDELREAALEELSRLRGRTMRCEIVLVSDDDSAALHGLPVTHLSPRLAGVRSPFLVYLGETPAYVWLRERDSEGATLFHSSDRALVEHLAFQLQRDLGRTPTA